MKSVRIHERTGSLAENKDIGRDIRLKEIMPALENNQEITLDFEKVESATQSFIHSLISDALRKYKDEALNRIAFKSCNDAVKQMVKIVVDYMQDAEEQNKPKD
jgi:hypothetical protein